MTKEICGNCAYWKSTVYDYGECSEIGGAMELDVIAGWDGGYVRTIETEKSFGCVLFVADGVNE
ncbi:hypothetical protein [Sporosarcina psychrophila]|uniref:Phage protein n=1 Tax=Sporosarcina psychrophila TaxID=1476 RepID=A0ABV2KEU3_SPOPS